MDRTKTTKEKEGKVMRWRGVFLDLGQRPDVTDRWSNGRVAHWSFVRLLLVAVGATCRGTTGSANHRRAENNPLPCVVTKRTLLPLRRETFRIYHG